MLLIDWLVANYPNAKRQTLRRMVSEGRVRVGDGPARSLKQEVGEGAGVRVAGRIEAPPAEIHPLKIVHEDGDVLVVLKPAGLLTSTVARERRPTAIGIIRRYLEDREPGARAGVIHRLDRDASGLLVFSKHNEAFQSLKRQFFAHSVERVYTAIVHGHPEPKQGTIESRLVERPDGSVHSTRNPAKGEEAVTEYEVKAEIGAYSLLRVRLETGRKHQIRAHLSERGWPVVNDSVYAKDKPAVGGGRLLLSATRLAFDSPGSGARLEFEVAPPAEFQRVIDSADRENHEGS